MRCDRGWGVVRLVAPESATQSVTGVGVAGTIELRQSVGG
jgi:hypothetical protein